MTIPKPKGDGSDGHGRTGLLRLAGAFCLWGALASLLLPARGGAADVEEGRRQAGVCVACHGQDGNSTQPTIPSLAGQQPLYTFLQLVQFREKRRTDPQMSPFAANLTDAAMEDIAAYYAAQRPFAARRAGDPAKVSAGRQVADAHHCASCHAPGLAGQKHIPRLVGQQYEYLLKEMRAFSAQTRADIDGSMTTAAQPLSAQEIENLVQYIADLPSMPSRRASSRSRLGATGLSSSCSTPAVSPSSGPRRCPCTS